MGGIQTETIKMIIEYENVDKNEFIEKCNIYFSNLLNGDD